MSMVTVWSADWRFHERIPVETVNSWMEDGAVKWGEKPNRRGRPVPALVMISELKLRDTSQSIGARVMFRIACGSRADAALRDSYFPAVRAGVCATPAFA